MAQPRSSAPCAPTTESIALCRSLATSVSVSVRSGARNRSANARLRRPRPSASEANTSKQRTSSSTIAECSAQRAHDRGGGHRLVGNEGEVDHRGRETRQRDEALVAAGRSGQAVERDLERDDGTIEPERGDHVVGDLTDMADRTTTDFDSRDPAAPEPGHVGGLEREVVDSQGGSDRSEGVDRVVDVDGAVVLDRAPAHAAGDGSRDVLGLLREDRCPTVGIGAPSDGDGGGDRNTRPVSNSATSASPCDRL